MNYGIILIREKEVSLAVVTDHGELLDEQTLPAGDACDTMFDAADWFFEKELVGFSVSVQGVIDTDPSSEDYGVITETEMDGWQGYCLLDELDVYGLPIVFGAAKTIAEGFMLAKIGNS